MLEQPRHLANKYEDIVNFQWAGHIVVASRTACYTYFYDSCVVYVLFIVSLCNNMMMMMTVTEGLWCRNF